MKNRFVNQETIIVFFLILLAFVLRVFRLNTDLLITYDQGMHAYGSYQIWHDHVLKLLGHPTDVDGLFHGPFYYLLMSIPYALSGGSPFAASLFQILLEVFTLPLFYIALKRLFSSGSAKLTLFIYAISYGLIGYSRWLSNVTPIFPLSHLLLFLVTFEKISLVKTFWIGLIVGLIFQLNAAIGFTLIFSLIIAHPKLRSPKIILLYLLGVAIPAIPQLLFELRHNFVITRAFIAFSQNKDQGAGFDIGTVITNIRVFLVEIDKVLLFPYFTFTVVLFFWSLLMIRNDAKLRWLFFLYLFPAIILGIFHRGAISFFYVYLLPLSLGTIIYGILKLPRLLSLLIITFIVTVNVLSYTDNYFSPSNALTPIGTQNILTIKDRQNVIDWVYTKAEGEQFSVWIYPIPYLLDQPWTYFFDWYGFNKYGYLPEKTGSFSPNDLKNSEYFFAIYEPDFDRPTRLEGWKKEVFINFGPIIDTYESHAGKADFHQLQ